MYFPTGADQYSAGPTRDLNWPIGISLCRPGRVGGFWWMKWWPSSGHTGSTASFARTRVADFRAFQILEQFRRVRILFLAINRPMRSLTWISAGFDWRGYYYCHATFRTTSHRHFLGFLSFEIKYVHLNNCFHIVLLLLPFNCVAESTVESSNL